MIKRYDMDYWPDENETEMVEEKDGEWVKYEDIKHLIPEESGCMLIHPSLVEDMDEEGRNKWFDELYKKQREL